MKISEIKAQSRESVRRKFQRVLEESNAEERLKQILIKTKNPDTWMKAFSIAADRAWGRPQQEIEVNERERGERPSTEALINTIRELREALKSAGSGTKVEAGK